MKKIYYEKVGRRYVAVSEYDHDLTMSLPKGAHLILVYPGGSSTKYNIDPNYAAMIAAGRIAEDVVSQALRKASDLRPRISPLTPGQKAAWDNLATEFGENAHMLEWPSAREVAEAAVKAMTVEALKLMTNTSVRTAYEHFQLLCNLSKTDDNT